MDKFAELIVSKRKIVIIIFLAAAAVCTCLQFFVKTNYNMADYLPPDAQSTKAYKIMITEFTDTMPNTSVMVKGVSVAEALEFKKKLSNTENVSQVMWLDDMADIKQPLEILDSEMVDSFYKNGNALFQVTIDKGKEQTAIADIYRFIGSDGAVSGEAPDIAAMQSAAGSEASGAMIFLIPIIIFLLVITSSSWTEPLLFLINIGVAILINMGLGIFLGQISFMSFSVSPILQLACSLDYGIFLMHSFQSNREKYGDVNTAMKHSIKESMSTVAASAMTTLFGFLALMFMNFRIGADLGINLAKGIIVSFVCAVIFLPAVTLCMYKLIDKTRHKPFTPEFKNVHKGLSKIAVPMIAIVAVIVVPSYLGQGQTAFRYGSEFDDMEMRTTADRLAIREEFGQSTVFALLVPKGNIVKERDLCDELDKIEHVTGIMSYALTVGTAIPPEYPGDDITSRFYSKNYARIIVYTDTSSEGDEAFGTVEKMQTVAEKYYGGEAYSLGQSANLYDMKTLVKTDNIMVNLAAVISIFLVLLINFRSAILPFLLLLTIETGIWLNLSIPYFTDTPINFIGYLVLSTVQLGATVDYAILLTTSYMRERKIKPKREAIHDALGSSFKSILVSGLTLSVAGFILAASSSNPSIADIGMLLGRGTIFSVLMVTCFLPGMLTLLDKPIGKTTYKADFLR